MQLANLLAVAAVAAILVLSSDGVYGTGSKTFTPLTARTEQGTLSFWASDYGTDWVTANFDCSERGARLLSIKDAQLQNAVNVALTTSNLDRTYWVSLHRTNTSGPWLWGDQTVVNYTNWHTGEPASNDRFGYVLTYPGYIGTWGAVQNATNPYNFLCI